MSRQQRIERESIMEKQETLRISGWYLPPAEKEIFRLIAQAGFNHIFLQGDRIGNGCGKEEVLDRYLSLCDDFGLRALVQLGDVPMSETLPILLRLREHPSWSGVMVFDEPPADRFEDLCCLYEHFFREGKLGEFFVNLFPSYARSESIIHDYAAYVRSFAAGLNRVGGRGEWLSFDHYPLIYDEQGEFALSEHWLDDLRTVAETGKRFGMPQNAFIQAMPFSNGEQSYGSRDRIPGFAELSLQAYACLAFGFRSLTYFCLGTPLVNEEFLEKHYAIFDRTGAPTPTFSAVKTLNAEIRAFESVFCRLGWTDAFLLGPGSAAVSGLQTETDGQVLIGCLTGTEDEGWILLNFGEPSREPVKTVRFRAPETLRLWKEGRESRGDRQVVLRPGQGAFVLRKRS